MESIITLAFLADDIHFGTELSFSWINKLKKTVSK